MTKLEMLPAWAGRISDPPVKTANGHHPVAAEVAPEVPLAEWVVNRQPIEPEPPVPAVPETATTQRAEIQPAVIQSPVVVDPGPGTLRRLLRALLVVVVMALIIGAGVGAGYLYTSVGG